MAEMVKNIAFTKGKGLDVFSNPHSMPVTNFTQALGVACNRADYGYPGPGYAPQAFIPASVVASNFSQVFNYGVGSLALNPPQNQDVIVPWWGGVNSTLAAIDTPPGISLPTSIAGALPVQSPVYPFRQKTERAAAAGPKSLALNDGSGNTTQYTMASAPIHCANANWEVMSWRATYNTGGIYALAFSFRAIGADAWSPPYAFAQVSTGVYNLTLTPGNNVVPANVHAICMTDSKFHIITMFTNGAAVTLTGDATATSNPLASATTNTDVWSAAGTIFQTVDCVAINNVALFMGLTGTPTVLATGKTDGGGMTAFATVGTPLATSPISCSPMPFNSVPSTTGGTFAMAYINASSQPVYAIYAIGGGTLNAGPTSAVTSLTGSAVTLAAINTSHVPKQISIGQNRGPVGFSYNLNIAIEYQPTTPFAPASGIACSYNSVLFFNVMLSTSATIGVNSKMVGAWGGLAIAGKWANWAWATAGGSTKYTGLIPCRSGWNHINGVWGTPASPSGAPRANANLFYYDDTGFNLVAKAGDGDVQAPPKVSYFPAMGTTNYGTNRTTAVNGLTPLSAPVYQTLADGRLSLSWPWAQLAYYDTTSVTINYASGGGATSNAGSPLAFVYDCSPAVTTFYAPTASEPAAPMQQYGTELAIPGALPMWFDGTAAHEMGYLQRTPTPIITQSVGGSLTLLATYYVLAVAVYVDAQGREHKAAPSDIVGVTLTGSNNNILLVAPYMKQTYKGVNVGLQFVRLDVYQSVGFSTATAFSSLTFYKAFALQGGSTKFITNAPGAIGGTAPNVADFFTQGGAVTIGNLSDAVLQTMPQLYTTNLPLYASAGYTAPPPFDAMAVWNSRLWGLTSRNGNELWFTDLPNNNQYQPSAANWSPTNVLQLPADLGICRAIVGLDNNLVCMGSRSDYALQGDGPVNGTTFADYNNPPLSFAIQLPSPSAIRVLNGVTRLPNGILYQGAQGFTLLDRSLQYHDVGAPVDPFADGNLYLPGVLLPSLQAALLYCANDTTKNLMYFYNEDVWSQQEQPAAGLVAGTTSTPIISSCYANVAGGRLVLTLPSTGAYYQQVQPYSQYMTWRTPWIEMGPTSNALSSDPYYPTGMGTLREVQVFGDLAASVAHTLTLTTEFDYANNTSQPPNTQTLTFTGLVAEPTPDYQWRFGLPMNNVRRVRFTLTFNQQQASVTPPAVAPVLFSGLVLSYFSEDGQSRLGANASTGF